MEMETNAKGDGENSSQSDFLTMTWFGHVCTKLRQRSSTQRLETKLLTKSKTKRGSN